MINFNDDIIDYETINEIFKLYYKADTESDKDNNQYGKQLAENCCFKLQNIIYTLDIADLQIKKLSEVILF